MLLAALAWLTVRALTVRSELAAARTDLAQARTALTEQRLDAADADIARAGRRTAKAAAAADDPLVRAAARVPFVGRSVAVVRGIAAAADEVARGVLPDALSTARTLDPAKVRRPDGSVDLAAVEQSRPRLAGLARRAAGLQAATHRLPTRGVVGPVDRARTQIQDQVDQLTGALRAASEAVDLAPALLGADRTRRYFVLVQQTSESRGTGGLPGGFAVLEASKGRLRVTAQGSNAELKNGDRVVPPGMPADYLRLYGNQGAFTLWQNINLSPDLPTVSRVVAARWKHQSGQSVDGVIALDALALADLLRGSGPIDLGNRTLPPDQLPDYLAIGQYREFSTLDRQGARKEKLTLVARAATRRLTSGGGDNVELLRGLVHAVVSGHLRMASDDPALSARLHAAGVDGALPDGPAPVAYPVVFNGSAGKLDYFLDRSLTYTAAACNGATRRSTITVSLRNSAPARGLPPYLTIFTNVRGQQQSDMAAVSLAVYTTRGSEFAGAELDGTPISLARTRADGAVLRLASERGLPRWDVFLDLPRGATRTLILHLDEPLAPGAARTPEQPLARPLKVTSRVPVCG